MLHVIYNRIVYLEENSRTSYLDELDIMEDMLNDIRDNFKETIPPKEDRAMLMCTTHRLKLARANATSKRFEMMVSPPPPRPVHVDNGADNLRNVQVNSEEGESEEEESGSSQHSHNHSDVGSDSGEDEDAFNNRNTL